MKNEIILDERLYAERMLCDGFDGIVSYRDLSILAKYYYHIEGLRKKKILGKLIEYLQTNGHEYKDDWHNIGEMLEKIAGNAGKYKLYEISGVRITRAELEVINNLRTKKIRRFAFTLLCLAKLSNLKSEKKAGWVNQKPRDIFKLAHITCCVDEQNSIISDMYDLDLVDFAEIDESESIRVKYINDDSDEVLFVSDFRELGYEYLLYCGENYIRCAECGVLTRGNKNGDKRYCHDCAIYNPIGSKVITCIDCGEVFVINSMNTKSKRCPYCTSIHDKETKSIRNKRYYEKLRR